MIGKISEEMEAVMRMSAIGMQELEKQRRHGHGRNEVLWEKI